jgi:hypothetical protein
MMRGEFFTSPAMPHRLRSVFIFCYDFSQLASLNIFAWSGWAMLLDIVLSENWEKANGFMAFMLSLVSVCFMGYKWRKEATRQEKLKEKLEGK